MLIEEGFCSSLECSQSEFKILISDTQLPIEIAGSGRQFITSNNCRILSNLCFGGNSLKIIYVAKLRGINYKAFIFPLKIRFGDQVSEGSVTTET